MLNLSSVFYDLYEDGTIYNEPDENGMDMSYGEIAAVDAYMWSLVEDELSQYYTFEEKLEAFKEIVDSADDDTLMFWTWDRDNDFYFNIDEDAETYSFYGTLPECLRESWEDFKRTTYLQPDEYSAEPNFV